MIPLLAGTDYRVVALCMSDEGMPKTAADRLRIADKLINGLVQNRIPPGNIYVDPLVQPISVDGTFGIEFLKAIALIKEKFPGVHAMCGLSNVSYGLPGRAFVNQTFMSMAVAYGLDGAIINPLDKRMMANIIAAEALAGRDNYCMNFMKAHRARNLNFKRVWTRYLTALLLSVISLFLSRCVYERVSYGIVKTDREGKDR